MDRLARILGFKTYADPRRKIGSQSESPSVSIDGDRVRIDGYQNFAIAGGRVDRATLSEKYRRLSASLMSLNGSLTGASSFLDIGCSAGLLSFLAKEAGFSAVTALDHDPEYIGVVGEVARLSGLSVRTVVGQWRDARHSFDVVAAISLIHWIFSLTAAEGSFDAIFSYLASITNRYLLIEWVERRDIAILKLGHVFRNLHVQQEAYNIDNFLASADRCFGSLEATVKTRSTRRVYIFRKEGRIEGHSAIVHLSPTSVRKIFKPRWASTHPTAVAREVRALRALSSLRDGFPMLLDHGPTEIRTTHVGERLTADNIPADAESQGRNLVAILHGLGIAHNDISASSLLVKDGKLSLVDFTSATFENERYGSIFGKIGLRPRPDRHNTAAEDTAMMALALRSIRNTRAGP